MDKNKILSVLISVQHTLALGTFAMGFLFLGGHQWFEGGYCLFVSTLALVFEMLVERQVREHTNSLEGLFNNLMEQQRQKMKIKGEGMDNANNTEKRAANDIIGGAN